MLFFFPSNDRCFIFELNSDPHSFSSNITDYKYCNASPTGLSSCPCTFESIKMNCYQFVVDSPTVLFLCLLVQGGKEEQLVSRVTANREMCARAGDNDRVSTSAGVLVELCL